MNVLKFNYFPVKYSEIININVEQDMSCIIESYPLYVSLTIYIIVLVINDVTNFDGVIKDYNKITINAIIKYILSN